MCETPLESGAGVRKLIPKHLFSSLLVSESRRCLLYTSDAADERSSVDLGGRRIIKKKNDKAEQEGS